MMDPICSQNYRLTPQETRILTLLLQGHHKKTAAGSPADTGSKTR